MPLSIRTRLTLWYTAILLTMTLLAGGTSMLTYQALSADAPQDRSKLVTTGPDESKQPAAVTGVVQNFLFQMKPTDPAITLRCQ